MSLKQGGSRKYNEKSLGSPYLTNVPMDEEGNDTGVREKGVPS